jgi:hypothetical protein
VVGPATPRIVLHWHSDVVRQRLMMPLYAPLQRWLLARADAVIATSPPYAEASATLAPWRGKVHVIPSALPTAGTAGAGAVQTICARPTPAAAWSSPWAA